MDDNEAKPADARVADDAAMDQGAPIAALPLTEAQDDRAKHLTNPLKPVPLRVARNARGVLRRVPKDAPAGTGCTLDAIEAERYQRDNEDVFKIKPRLELDVRRDRGARPLSPLWAETELLRRCQRVYYEPLRQDVFSFGGGGWQWAAACSWVAWQTPAGALQGAAAFDYWGPLVWRDKLRPNQKMTMSEAEAVLRHALETGEIVALAVLDGMQVKIQKNEWAHLKWKCNDNEEVVAFDQLCIGAKCYHDVKVSASQLLGKYPAKRDEIELLPAEQVRDEAEAKAPAPAAVMGATALKPEQSDVFEHAVAVALPDAAVPDMETGSVDRSADGATEVVNGPKPTKAEQGVAWVQDAYAKKPSGRKNKREPYRKAMFEAIKDGFHIDETNWIEFLRATVDPKLKDKDRLAETTIGPVISRLKAEWRSANNNQKTIDLQ